MNDIHRMGLVLPFTNKHTYILIYLLTLIIGCYSAKAQDSKAIDITTKGIQIGQQVPEITITNIYNYKTNSAKISDFKGKLLIIDFWATWCSPCIAMIPKMDTLQKQFGDKIQFLSVTYESEKVALPFLSKLEQQQKKHYNLPIVYGDKDLHNLFPHAILPHYVWISPKGEVNAITEGKEINKENIAKMLSGSTEINRKSDFKVDYDNKKPFLINGNGGDGSSLLYHSVLTNFTEGIGSGYDRTPLHNKGEGKITYSNTSMLHLYRLAYGGYNKYFGINRLVLNVRDIGVLRLKKSGNEYLEWLRNGHGYCYELVVPSNLSAQMFEIMKNDLSTIFSDYSVKVENKKVKCLVLKRTSNLDKFKTSGGETKNDFSPLGCEMKNSSFSALTVRMEVQFMQNSLYPIVDGTNYKGGIDLKINGRLSDLTDLNAELAKYDLKFQIEDYLTDLLIVEDKAKLTVNQQSIH